MASAALAEDTIIYDHITGKGFNAELRFLDLSDLASDIDPDPENWEDISRVGAKLGLAGTARLVTQVDVQLDNYLERAYTATMFLQFHRDDAVGGGPGTPIGAEITAPITVDTTANGPFVNVIDFSFTGLSTDLSGLDTVWYSLGIRNVLYTGGTGSFYLAQISDRNGPSVGSHGFGFWELDPPSGSAPGWHLSDQFGGDWGPQAPNIRIFAAGAAGNLGDYNGDLRVDAADYVVWRNSNINGEQGYLDWRANFGAVYGPASAGIAVPEPASLMLAALCHPLLWAARRRRCSES